MNTTMTAHRMSMLRSLRKIGSDSGCGRIDMSYVQGSNRDATIEVVQLVRDNATVRCAELEVGVEGNVINKLYQPTWWRSGLTAAAQMPNMTKVT